ncbi:MAG: hypothetical protein P4L39_00050 [Humidesulfovibrio sp.]|nr:hypothetical protein [Humidesulfovibrio sp.]
MSAPIKSATSTAAGLAESLDAARPQMQSRRVSFKLGPLGITYSTDQVLWSAAAGTAATATSALVGATKSGLTGASAEDAAGVRQAEADQTAQIEAQRTGASFSQEMLNAWRRQVADRQSDTATYGPDGKLDGSLDSVQDSGKALGSAEEGPDGDQQTDTSTRQNASPAQQQTSGPASRARRAIAAYLACAQNHGAVRPMLTAVA